MTYLFDQYKLNNYISCILAYLGIGIWAVEHEIYLQNKDKFQTLRILLLWWNMFVNIWLIISITFGYHFWLRFNNLVRPEQEWKIGSEKKRIKSTFWNSSILTTYCIEVFLNCITSYPWFYNTTFTETIKHDVNGQFYLNTLWLTFMIIIRTYHFIKCWLQLSPFMTDRAERITRIFCQSSKYFYKYWVI